jgi:hypothetical protein
MPGVVRDLVTYLNGDPFRSALSEFKRVRSEFDPGLVRTVLNHANRVRSEWARSNIDCALSELDRAVNWAEVSRAMAIRRTAVDERGRAEMVPIETEFDAESAEMIAETQDAPHDHGLPDIFVASLHGNIQRKLLRALNGKGNVLIDEVLHAVYGSKDESKLEALLKAVQRANARLTEKNLNCEIRREGETLLLSPVNDENTDTTVL